MKKRRIVITGVGCVSPYGTGLTALTTGIDNYKCSLKLDNYLDKEYVVGKVPDFNEKDIPREYSRTMPRMGKYAYKATCEALVRANINPSTTGFSSTSTVIASGLGSAIVTGKQIGRAHV